MDRTESRNTHPPEPASDDVASPFNPTTPSQPNAPAPDEPPPWEGDPPEETGRQRRDAFTGARKQQYLKALAKHGCILDACRVTGISSSTVYNHQKSDPEFERHCQLATAMAATPIELTAYERAVVGQEEPVIRGGKVVGTRMKRSDYMLRVLLQGSNPRKYGSRPGFSRKRLLKFERKQIEREVRAELEQRPMSFQDAIIQLDQALDHLGDRAHDRRREQGWTELGCGVWIPPGWVWTGEGDSFDAVARLEKKNDAVSNSSNSSTSASLASPSPDGEGDQVEPGGGVEGEDSADQVPEPPASVPLPLHHASPNGCYAAGSGSRHAPGTPTRLHPPPHASHWEAKAPQSPPPHIQTAPSRHPCY